MLKEINFGDFNTNNVINMSKLFSGCISLEKIDFNEAKNFRTGNVIDMSYMFQNCLKLEILDLNLLNTSNVVYMNNMFDLCKNLMRRLLRNNLNLPWENLIYNLYLVSMFFYIYYFFFLYFHWYY